MNLTKDELSPSKKLLLNKKLGAAVEHVQNSWIPVNPVLYHDIRSGLASGQYLEKRDVLLQEVKKDPSLFLYCIRKLSELSQSRPETFSDGINPNELIVNSPSEDIQKIFELPTSIMSSHRFEQMTDHQAERVKNSLLSATVAEALSQQKGIKPETAYSCALFRQLGLTLISWNYPNVYSRVISTLKTESDLDEALSKLLGFSPSTLGVAIARSWCINPGIRAAMGDEQAKGQLKEEELAVAQSISTICEVGEALARANSPEIYPTAKNDWSLASTEIERTLGSDGFKKLKKSLESNLAHYLSAAPNLFKLPELIPQEKILPSSQGLSLLNKNKYVSHCPPLIRERFSVVYSKYEASTIVKETLTILIQDIILPLGFTKGCIYLVEPDTLTLIPRLSIGEKKLGEYSSVRYSSFDCQGDPVVAAFRSAVPLVQENTSPLSEPHIAGILGNVQRAGVLYIEATEKFFADSHSNPMVYFKAVRQTLNDCLHLG